MRNIVLSIVCACIVVAIAMSYGGCGKVGSDYEDITIWHWMTDRDEVLQELAGKYEEQTGIKIRIDLYAPSDVYSRKVTAAAQAKVLPDIYGVLEKKKVFASYVKNGLVADLTEVYTEDNSSWKNSFFEKALNANRFEEGNSYGVNPGIYGVPLDVTNIQMLYNKKLLKKAGFDNPPKTFAEFLEVAATLKRIGSSVFVSGWSELWLMDAFASNYAFNIMGEEKVMATIVGDVPYTDPDWIKVLDVFRQMRDSGALIEDIVTKGNKYAEQDFALERAAFAFNGSWCVNVYGKMNPDLEYAPMIPPAVNSERPMSIWGGAGSSFVVNERSTKKAKAIDFLKWLTKKEQQVYFAEKTKNLPANKHSLTAVDPVLSGFAEGVAFATHPTIWKYNEFPQVSEKFDKGIQSIIIGDKTPAEVAKEVQGLKEEMLEKERRRNKK